MALSRRDNRGVLTLVTVAPKAGFGLAESLDLVGASMWLLLAPTLALTGRSAMSMSTNRRDFKERCAHLLRGGMNVRLAGVMPEERHVIPTENHQQFISTISPIKKMGGMYVAVQFYPVIDFASTVSDWYNCKEAWGKATVNSGDFVKVVQDLGLADDNLEMQQNITLTMMRYSPDGFELLDTGDFDKVKALFENHVTVKFIDMTQMDCDWDRDAAFINLFNAMRPPD